MSSLRTLVAIAALTAGSAAMAGTSHLSDSQYIAAAHCQGLFDAHALGVSDASGINALMRSEGAYRAPEVSDRASEAKEQSESAARRAGPLERSALISERDGVCQVWAKSGASGGMQTAAGN